MEPQASAAEKLEKEDVVVVGAKGVDFGVGCAGVEMLNAELIFEVGATGFDGEGLEKLKRSLEVFMVVCSGVGDVVVAKL